MLLANREERPRSSSGPCIHIQVQTHGLILQNVLTPDTQPRPVAKPDLDLDPSPERARGFDRGQVREREAGCNRPTREASREPIMLWQHG